MFYFQISRLANGLISLPAI